MEDIRQHFGHEHREQRLAAGLTQVEVAHAIGYSLRMIESVEQGIRAPSPTFAEGSDALFGLHGMLVRLGARAREEKPGFTGYLELERTARRIRSFELRLVHGLLQTAEYASALLRDDRLVTERLDRQKRVLSGELTMHAVVDESVLLRNVGGPEVMRGQLFRLLGLPDSVTLQVIPLSARVHAGVDGPLTLLDFPDEPPVAHADSRHGGLLIDTAEEVNALDDALHGIIARALDPDLSQEMITSVLEDT